VYFVPGLGASSSIFEHIKLPTTLFEMHCIEWLQPIQNETLVDYAQRMSVFVTEPNCILVGVSFGGILVQEMAQFVQPKKVVIISSIKSNQELPAVMQMARKTLFYKILPTRLLGKIPVLASYVKGRNVLAKSMQLYKKYLSMHDTYYLDWSIKQILYWNRSEANPEVIHIHGDLDGVFPIKYCNPTVVVKGGTHIMIINKYKWFNSHLPQLLLE
jgi:pimeloyl-ACP methyl ester carboxylesterase